MADEDPVVLPVELGGKDETVAGLKEIGDAGAEAFDKIAESAEKAAPSMEKVGSAGDEAAKKILNSVSEARTAVDNIGSSIDKLGEAVKGAGGAAESFAKNTIAIGSAAATAVGGVIALARHISNTLFQANQDGVESTKALSAAIRDQYQEAGRAITSAANLEKSHKDLNREYASGTISSEKYAKKLLEVNQKHREGEEQAKKLAAAHAALAEQRAKDIEKMEKQQATQKKLNELYRTYGADLAQALIKLGGEVDKFWEKFTQGPSLASKFVNKLTELLSTSGDKIVELYNRASDAIGSIFSDEGETADQFSKRVVSAMEQVVRFIENVLVPAIKKILQILDVVAKGINSVFGTELTGGGLAAIIILGQLTGAFGLLWKTLEVGIATIRVLGTVIAFLLRSAFGPWGIVIGVLIAALVYLVYKIDWNNLADKAKAAIDAVVEAWGKVKDFFSDIWDKIKTSAGDLWDWMVTKVSDAVDGIKKVFADFVDWFMSETFVGKILSGIGKIIGKLKEWYSAATKAKDAQDGAQSAAGGDSGGDQPIGDVQLAGGGHVVGRGTETSDSIWARLSTNEWVMRAAAVRKYGHGVMAAINSMRLDPSIFGRLANAASESLVPAHAPQQFAAGGLVMPQASPGRPFNLVIGGEVFENLMAPEKTAERLVRYAVSKQSRSAGKRPGWVGGTS
jgi:hypothetical protein